MIILTFIIIGVKLYTYIDNIYLYKLNILYMLTYLAQNDSILIWLLI